MASLDRGEIPPPYFKATFHHPDQRHRVTLPANLKLFRAIARKKPERVRETARLVNRDVRQAHDNLTEFEALGLIDMEEDGSAKRHTV